jgi:predicted alpha/beta-hydrolase family hydrolase
LFLKSSYPATLDCILEVETPHGPARVELRTAADPKADPEAAVLLGHGAGGGTGAPDLQAATKAALELGLSVALIEQPYRVAGRRSPAPAHQLDAAWLAVAEQLRADALKGLALIVGGRSSGARVACRTAREAGAMAVLCLAFPLHLPGKGGDLTKSRLPELEAVRLPILIVQGERDPFGMPPEGASRTVVRVPGNHSLRATAAVGAAVSEWLGALRLPRRAERSRGAPKRAQARRPTTRTGP